MLKLQIETNIAIFQKEKKTDKEKKYCMILWIFNQVIL